MIVIGLKTCETCRKAMNALKGGGHSPSLRDVREEPLSDAEIAEFLGRFDDELINKRSTTWRALSEQEREASPASLLSLHPSLMKRPVIVSDAGVTLGWTSEARAVHLGGAAADD